MESAFSMYKSSKRQSKKKPKRKSSKLINGATATTVPIYIPKAPALSMKKKHIRVRAAKKSENAPMGPEAPRNESPEPIQITDDSIDSSAETFHSPLSSVEQGREMLAWLIHPYSLDDFMRLAWEKKPIYVDRDEPDYYKKIISSEEIDSVLRKEFITFTKNIDITSYENGVRETHNPIGRALPHIVWDYYSNGCSVRFLNPQTYISAVHLLNATLQDYFNCFVGSNVYLTPPNSQGFAPHYDDIEAFVLQVEGKKLWRIYNPITEEERLPRFSSKNFDQSEIGKPIMEIELKAGDMLYFPRGYIHQAVTVDGEHSLHITVSTYQKHTWADIFEKMIPKALEVAFLNDIEFRKGAPTDLFRHTGLAHFNSNADRRKDIVGHMKRLFSKLCDHLPIDYAVDQFSKNFMHDALPPALEEKEKQTTVFGNSSQMKNGKLNNKVQIEPDTKVRLLRDNILRLVEEDGAFNVYYTIENSKEYHENELQFLEISEDQVKTLVALIGAYPNFTVVKDLNLEDEEMTIQLISALWEKGLLAAEKPLDVIG